MKSHLRASALLLGVLFLAATPAAAHNIYNWYPSSWVLSRAIATWRTTGDSFVMRAQMWWNQSNADAMHHMATHGYRYTHDVQDRSSNVNANGQWETNMPFACYDRDPNSSSGGRNHEGEITSEWASFPSATLQYNSRVRFSHWYQECGSVCNWRWDSDGGHVTQTAQISQPGCWFVCDKWDAAQGLADKTMGDTTYPFVAAPSSAAAELQWVPETAASSIRMTRLDRPAFGVHRHLQDGGAILQPDLSGGRQAFIKRTQASASALVGAGPARGIMTFARPVGMRDVRRLERAGVDVESLKAVTTGDRGPRWWIGSPDGRGVHQWFAERAAANGEALLGIVSAQVVVTKESLAAASADADVFLVDLAIEEFGRSTPGAKDVSMNDVFWMVADWDS